MRTHLFPQPLVSLVQFRQSLLPLLDLLAQLKNLIFLPHISDSRPADHRTEQKRLQRWTKAERCRPVFSVAPHVIPTAASSIPGFHGAPGSRRSSATPRPRPGWHSPAPPPTQAPPAAL